MITLTPETIYPVLFSFLAGLILGAILGFRILGILAVTVGLLVSYTGYLIYIEVFSQDMMIAVLFGSVGFLALTITAITTAIAEAEGRKEKGTNEAATN